MDTLFIVPVLALITLLTATLGALWSKHRTEERRHDPTAPNSTLAEDGSDHGHG